MPDFGAQKAVIASLDLVAAIKTVAVLEPVKIIAHYGGMVGPAAGRLRQIVIAIKKAGPLAGFIDSRETDQLRAQARNHDPQPVFLVRECVRHLPSRSSSLCENFIVFWP